MNPLLVSLAAFLCIFGGAVAGLLLKPLFPAQHLTKESQDSAKLGAGLIATMAALILGLLVSSAKGTYDRVNILINEAAANHLCLDQTLRAFGPQADPVRVVLRERLEHIAKDFWPEDFGLSASLTNRDPLKAYKEHSILELQSKISDLPAANEFQKSLRDNAIRIATELNQQRWKIIVESTSVTPLVLVIIPIFWITFLTLVYGLFAERNGTVLAVLFLLSAKRP